MDALQIHGGRPIEGVTRVSGAKNAALPILAASLLSPGTHRFRNVPRLSDVATMCNLLAQMGCTAKRRGGAVAIQVPPQVKPEAPYALVKTMRASVVVLGPLLARYGWARVSLPGGCAIGARPIDQHLKALEALGANIELSGGYVTARAKRLRGARIHFDMVTVTGTENALMAAVLAEGTTQLENAACEPEVVDLATMLIGMGARIHGIGTPIITIEGVPALGLADHSVIADRIEAGTLLAAAAITGGDVFVEGAPTAHLEAVLGKLHEAGCRIATSERGIHLKGPSRLRAVEVHTQEHPGFPTDMQAQLMAILATARGTSLVTENIFENRFMHVAELGRLGAQISVSGQTATVRGVLSLQGAPVMATDLRASASLVLAGLAAKGQTTVSRVYHLDRGYERLEHKLAKLGASVRRVHK